MFVGEPGLAGRLALWFAFIHLPFLIFERCELLVVFKDKIYNIRKSHQSVMFGTLINCIVSQNFNRTSTKPSSFVLIFFFVFEN
jgi:hypothetical protein